MAYLALFILLIVLFTSGVQAASGDLDTTFSGDGKVTNGNFREFTDIVTQPSDGKIVVVGEAFGTANSFDFGVVRYNTDGTLDTSFGSNGVATTSINLIDVPFALAIQSDGKIVAAGYTQLANSTLDIAVIRYNSNGTLDTSFDSDGIVTFGNGSVNEWAFDVAIQSDGKIVVAGFTNSSGDIFSIVRFNANGSVDNSFDGDGVAATAIGTGTSQARSLALQSDGKIVAAGRGRESGTNDDFIVVRYNTNGSLDTSFDSDGISSAPIIPNQTDRSQSLAIQTDGKIVVGGYTLSNSSGDFAVARFNSNGSLDTSFDSDGIVTTDISGDDRANSVQIQVDGKIIAAGFASTTSGNDFAIVRYNANGTLDNSWGSNGIALVDFASSFWDTFNFFGGSADRANAVALQTDGKVVAAGQASGGAGSIARLVNQPVTAAGITIGGRVTSAQGRGISRTVVQLTDQQGKIHWAITNPFGFYRFTNIGVGQTVVLSIKGKQTVKFLESLRVIFVSGEMSDVNFTALK